VDVISAISKFGHYLLTDSIPVGIVGWLGLVVTIGGFAIAIDQIRRTKTAAEAAKKASQELTTAVFGRERLLELATTIAHINSAKDRITQGRYEAALVFVDFSLTECIRIHELLDGPDRRKFYKCVVRLRKLGEGLSYSQGQNNIDANTSLDLAMEARNIVEALNEMAAKLRYNYNREGSE
jgi:hypothetical protein